MRSSCRERSPIVSLLGPRQTGKTTLARTVARGRKVTLFDLENPTHVARLSAPMQALDPLRGLVVIDEIQRLPKLFEISAFSRIDLDLMVVRGGKRYGFEMKLGDAPPVTKSMRIALDDLGLTRLIVVYPGRALDGLARPSLHFNLQTA